jgi:hypothetical protein
MSKEKNLFNKKWKAVQEIILGIIALVCGLAIFRHILSFSIGYVLGEKIILLLFGIGFLIGGFIRF